MDRCCICGKPSEAPEGELECDCICPKCGTHCFDDVTIADHNMCYDCFQKWKNGEE